MFSIEDIYIDYVPLGHKIKFKHISTLKFLNKNDNREWSILKDKLISNQFLKIDKDSINEFIYHCKNQDIIKLFLEKKKECIPVELDLVASSLENNNMVAFQIFIDYGYSITNKSIQIAIHYGNTAALKIIYNNKHKTIEQKYWLKLFRYKYVQLEIIEFYISANEPLLASYGATLQDKDKLDFTSFYSIKSLAIKYKLLEYDLVEKNEASSFFIYYIKNHNFGLIQTSYDVLFYINSFYNLCCAKKSIPLDIQLKIDNAQQNQNEQESIYQLNLVLLEEIQKRLHPSQYSNEMKSFFYHFLLNNKSIQGIHYVPSIYFYTFTTFSIEGLQYLIDQYSKSECIFNEYNNNPLDPIILKNDQDRVLNFMKLYYNQNVFKVPNEKSIVKNILLNCDIVILKSLMGIDKFKEQLVTLKFEPYEEFTFCKYKLFINQVQSQFNESTSHSGSLKIKIAFKDENEKYEYIDFINYKWNSLENIKQTNNSSTFQILIYPLLYSIDSKDTMNYFIKHFVHNLTDKQDQLFLQLVPFLFEYSILNVDICTLRFIEDKVGVQLNSYRGLFYKTSFKKSKEDAITILNHINSNHAFYQNHFYNIYQMFTNVFNKSILIDIDIDLNKFQRGISQVIYFSLVNYEFDFIKQIFEQTNYVINGNTFNQDNNLDNEQQFQTIFSVYKKSIYTIDNSDDVNYQMVYDFIEYLLNKVKNQESRSLFLESVLNYLFKIILRINGITIKQVEKVHQILKDNQIEIQQELYHVLYYIYLRYPKLFKYFYSNLNIINNITTYGISNNVNLNLNQFQFEFIVSGKCTFEILFFNIKDNLISTINQQHTNHYTNSNYNFLFNETLSNIKYLFEVNEYNIILNNIERFTLSNSIQEDLNALEIRNTIILNFLKELFTFIEIDLFIQINSCINASQDLIKIAANHNNRFDILNHYNNSNCNRIE